MTEAHNSSISSPTHNMFGKIMYLILSIRNLGKKKKRKYSNGSEVSYISEISYVSDDSYVSEDQVAIRESLRQSPTSLPAVQLNSNVGHFSFILFLSRFMHCLTIHQLAILSSIVVFIFNVICAYFAINNYVSNTEKKHLLENEIAEEASDSNKQYLQIKLDILNRLEVFIKPALYSAGMILVSSCVLIYGVVSKSKWCISQWLVFSVIPQSAFGVATLIALYGVLHYALWTFASLPELLFDLVTIFTLLPAGTVVIEYHFLFCNGPYNDGKKQTVQRSKNHVLEV